MLAGLLVGAAAGIAARVTFGDAPALETFVTRVTAPVGAIFLRLLFMLVVPLIVSGLALGVAGLGDVRRLGRIGLRTLGYTVLLSSIAVLLGVGLVNLLRPGEGLSPELRARLAASPAKLPAAAAPAALDATDFVVRLVPSNVVAAMAEGDMLAVMTFSLFLGL